MATFCLGRKRNSTEVISLQRKKTGANSFVYIPIFLSLSLSLYIYIRVALWKQGLTYISTIATIERSCRISKLETASVYFKITIFFALPRLFDMYFFTQVTQNMHITIYFALPRLFDMYFFYTGDPEHAYHNIFHIASSIRDVFFTQVTLKIGHP